jgi:hypothetical protein
MAAALVLLLPACGEKVGMRGPFHKLRLAEKPLYPDPLHSPSKTGVNALMARGEREQKRHAMCDSPALAGEGRGGGSFLRSAPWNGPLPNPPPHSKSAVADFDVSVEWPKPAYTRFRLGEGIRWAARKMLLAGAPDAVALFRQLRASLFGASSPSPLWAG